MKKTIIILLFAMFQLQSCKAQDIKKDIIGNWEQEFYNRDGEEVYVGDIWTFNTDGTCQINYGADSGSKITKFTYTITGYNCAENILVSGTNFLRLKYVSGSDEDLCFEISGIDMSDKSNPKIYMSLYAYGAISANVFVKR